MHLYDHINFTRVLAEESWNNCQNMLLMCWKAEKFTIIGANFYKGLHTATEILVDIWFQAPCTALIVKNILYYWGEWAIQDRELGFVKY